MRAFWVLPVLAAAACGASSSTTEPGKPTSTAGGQDCGAVCQPAPAPIAPRPPISPCDGPPGGLLGKVIVEGQPPKGKIDIVAVSSCARYPATSNDKGEFRLAALPLGDYVVEANVGTAARAYGEVSIRPGEVVTLELEMRGDEIERGHLEVDARQKCGCPLR